jgi:hypothetical protein
MQRAGHGTRRERVVNRVGAEICCAVILACSVSCNVMIRNRTIAAEAAAAGRARECRRPAAARMRNGRPSAKMPAAAGEPCPATVETAPTAAAEMRTAAVTTTTEVCAATVATAATMTATAMATSAMTATAASGRIGGG